MSNQIMTYKFRNGTKDTKRVWLEPWAEEVEIKPGSKLELKIHYVVIDTIETEQTDECFVIWLWRGCRAEVFVDGKDRTVSSMSIAAPV